MILYLIIILAIVTRFIPHMPNFAPITALAIFAGAYLPKKQAIAIPLIARFVSDIFLGFFSWPLIIAVYASHLLGVVFGLWIRKSENYRWIKIVGSSLLASVVFFLVTNFAYLYAYYPHSWAGIIAAYTNGLPFFRGTLLGDLGYSVALFGAYALARRLTSSKSNFKFPAYRQAG